ncbi:CapA family protein [Haliangium ochraceum]|uniref:CapA family protein n=1 Tax=Haliangium ochraceum TaxID=80816 RepID=UPI00019B962A|nr:CapA family protein [Haliangium ochraceum]
MPTGDASPPAPPPRTPPEDGDPTTYSVIVRVVDEAGAPLPDSTVALPGLTEVADERGEVVIAHRREPLSAVVAGNGRLAEPLVLGHEHDTQTVMVRLRARASGALWSMHAGGDVMFARRYYEPLGDAPPLIDPTAISTSARAVVAPVAAMFAAADLRSVNLETVVSVLPESDAHPGKRIVINSHPDTLAALDALGVDVAVLGNNHIRDYLDQGVSATLQALEAGGFEHVGALPAGAGSVQLPFVRAYDSTVVGLLSYSVLSGDPNNNALARDGESLPPDLDPADAWEYEARSWGFSGSVLSVPTTLRRAGSAWRLFRDAEDEMSESERAAAWASLSGVYPELEDGVARRGHGGAAYWTTEEAQDDIASLTRVTDALIVQVHGSFEFQTQPSPLAAEIARAAIDAGADAVLFHHPHVMQGFDWYKGKLIAYSLGNFVFDQNEITTADSGFLRLVWDGASLLQARLFPVHLGNFRPNPVADRARLHQLLTLWEQSALGAVAERDASGEVRVLLRAADADTQRGHLRLRPDGVDIVATPPASEQFELTLPAGASAAVPAAGLVRAQAGGNGVLLGRELFVWGDFEDYAADEAGTGGMQWRLDHSDAMLVIADDAGHGRGYATMARDADNESDASVFTSARVPAPVHRWFVEDGAGVGAPVDGTPSYTISLLARREGNGEPYLRMDLYPTEGLTPDAGNLGDVLLPIDIPADGAWHEVQFDLASDDLRVAGARMEAFRLNFRLRPPSSGAARFDIDDVRVLEWRPAAALGDLRGAFSQVRNPQGDARTVTLEVLPLHQRP